MFKQLFIKIKNWFESQPIGWDLLLAIVIVAIITWQPDVFAQRLNIFELGLYLPAIEKTLQGGMIYRDVFYLRGPLEVWLPALLMQWLGVQVAVLLGWFYVMNVAVVMAGVWLAKIMIRTRLLFWSCVLILVSRGFPRVTYPYWGGWRFWLGLVAVGMLMTAFRTGRRRFWLVSGVLSGMALHTSVDVGLASGLAFVVVCLYFCWQRSKCLRWSFFWQWFLGWGLVQIFVLGYLSIYQALWPYLNDVMTVVTGMEPTFDVRQASDIPATFGQVFLSWLNPTSKYFDRLTLLYTYAIFAGLLVYSRTRSFFQKSQNQWLAGSGLAISSYGLFLLLAGLRNIEGSQFEMALIPAKVLFFFILDRFYVCSQSMTWPKVLKKAKALASIKIATAWLMMVLFSTLGYAGMRIYKRFPIGLWLRGENPSRMVDGVTTKLNRLSGLRLPADQAEDLEKINDILAQGQNQPVLLGWEGAALHFITNTDGIGRHPMPIFIWMNVDWNEQWHQQFLQQTPEWLVMEHPLPSWFENVYFQNITNQASYQRFLAEIQNNYQLETTLHHYQLYRRQ